MDGASGRGGPGSAVHGQSLESASSGRPAGHGIGRGGQVAGYSRYEANMDGTQAGTIGMVSSGDSCGGSAVDRVVAFVAKRGGQTAGFELSRLWNEQPDLRLEVARAGGIKDFCDRHPHVLQFKKDLGSGVISCRLSSGHLNDVDFTVPNEVHRITGAISKFHKGSFFMESSAGTSDVYVPEVVFQNWPEKLKEGDVVTVAAVEHKVGKNRWKATMILPRSQMVKTNDDSALSRRFIGLVTKRFQGALFMESSPGVSDIFVPQTVVARFGSKLLTEGCVIIVDAVPHQRGECSWRALQILPTHAGWTDSVSAASCQELEDREPAAMSLSGVQVRKSTTASSEDVHSSASASVASKPRQDSAVAEERFGEDMGGTSGWSVIDWVLALVRKKGSVLGSELPSLYLAHPEAAAEVKQCGGLQGFCSKYGDQIEFENDGRSGRIIAKRSPAMHAATHARSGTAHNAFAILDSEENQAGNASSDEDSCGTASSEAVEPSSALVSQLTAMGFEKELALKALKRAKADVANAVDWIYDHESSDVSSDDSNYHALEQGAMPGHAAEAPEELNGADSVPYAGHHPKLDAPTPGQIKPSKISPKDAALSAKMAGDVHMQQWKYSAGRDAYTLAIYNYLEIPERSLELVADIGSAYVARAISCFKSENYLEALADCEAAIKFGISRSTVASICANSRLILCEYEDAECFKMFEKMKPGLILQTPATLVRMSKFIGRAAAALELAKSARQDAVHVFPIDLGKYVRASCCLEYFFDLVDNFWQRIEVCEVNLQTFTVEAKHEYDDEVKDNNDGSNGQSPESRDAEKLRVVCPNSECHTVLVMYYNKFFHSGWGKTPCWVCGRQYPWIFFVESAQQGLPDFLHSIWVRASKALSEQQGLCGEQFVEDARVAAVKVGLDMLPQDERGLSSYYDLNCVRGIGAACPQRTHSGTKLLLSHCIYAGDREMLAFFTQFPSRLEESKDFGSAFDDWVSKGGSWMWYFLQAGGLELALDFDENNPCNSIEDSLSYTVCSSIVRLIKEVKSKFPAHNIGYHNLFPLLEVILDVPELASKRRLDLAVSVVKSLAESEIPEREALFSSLVCEHKLRNGFGTLALACRTRRCEIVSAILDVGKHLVNLPCRGSFQPLHIICNLPPLNGCLDMTATFPNIKKVAKFSSLGFMWKVHVYTDPCDRANKQKSALLRQKKGASPATLLFYLALEESRSFSDSMMVQVELKVQISGDGSRSTSVHTCSFSSMSSSAGPLRIPIAELLKTGDAARDVSLRFLVTIGKLVLKGCAERTLRSVEDCQEHQLKIINLLVTSGADRDAYTSSGHSAFSLALESGLPDSILRLVFPKDIGRAINAALARKDSSVREISDLTHEISAERNSSKLQIARLSLRLARLEPTSADHTTLIKALETLLKAGVGPDDFSSALKVSVEHKDWISADVFVRNAVDGFSAKGIQLHAAVTSCSTILPQLLEAGACPNEARKTESMDNETPLHVTARLGNLPVLELFLKFKGDCNFKDRKTGNTPLHEAASWLSGTSGEKFIRVMLQNGADPGIFNSRKVTPSGCTKDRQMKKTLEEFASDAKSLAKKSKAQCKLESTLREVEVAPSDTSAKDNDATLSEVALPLHRPVLEPVSSGADERIQYHKQTRKVEVLEYDVRVANIMQALDNYLQSSMSSDRRVDDDSSNKVLCSSGEADCTNDCFSPPATSSIVVDPYQNFEEFEELASRIEGSVWDIRFTRDFKERLFQLTSNPEMLVSLLQNLALLAQGEHGQELVRSVHDSELASQFKDIFQSPVKTFDEKLVFVWQIAPDYSPRIRGFTDTIRLWRLCHSHSEVILPSHFITLAKSSLPLSPQFRVSFAQLPSA